MEKALIYLIQQCNTVHSNSTLPMALHEYISSAVNGSVSDLLTAENENKENLL